jgi:putative membrane protein
MHDSAGAPNETVQEMKDKMFLRKAAEGGLSQVQLAQLASTNSASPDVKELSQKLVDEHTKLNASMAAVADQIGVRLSNKIGKGNQEKYDKLKVLSGEAFDKEYLACAMRDHHEDLREFRVEAQMTTDPDMKALVEQGAKVLRENLVMTAKLAAQNGVPLPKHASKPEPTPPAPQ